MIFNKNYLPRWFHIQIKFIIKVYNCADNFIYDITKYLRYSMTFKSDNRLNKKNIEARIFTYSHIIEKGLTLNNRKIGYGQEVLKNLLKVLEQYLFLGYANEGIAFENGLSVIQKYLEIHMNEDIDISLIKADLIKLNTKNLHSDLSGMIEYTLNDIKSDQYSSFDYFCKSRVSIRNFSMEPVNIELIIKAIDIANKAPSSCNRQPSKVYILNDSNVKEEFLKLHNGNRGFGNLVDKFLIITSDLCCYNASNERNQVFIDGSLFAMSLIYSLHFIGLAACTLHWQVNRKEDKKIKRILGISNSENIILIIGVGNYPEKVLISKSPRKPVSDIIKII